ncbi:fumarate hydratase [Candidatus Parcubacteria bacterium]|nr:fumarate hydratase [Candidatus Parcubacteria bacterium]
MLKEKKIGLQNFILTELRSANFRIAERTLSFPLKNAWILAGSRPCPPVYVGVGIGGTLDKAVLLSKQAVFRRVGEHSRFPHVASLEKDMLKRINDLKIGVMGIGHCLSKDTLVQLADGRITPISKVKKGDNVLSFNLKTNKLESAQLEVACHASPEFLYQIRTSFGYLKCTGEHRMFVMSDGRIIEKKVKNLNKKNILIIPRAIEIKEQKMIKIK